MKYIITKKNEFSRKLKEYEKQKKTDEDELLEIATEEEKKKLKRFMNIEKNIISTPKVGTNLNDVAGPSAISNMTGDKKSQLPSFWAPSQTPDSGKAKMDKPSSKIYCPITGNPLKAKDLITIKFTVAPGESATSSANTEARYICAVSFKILSNSIACAVIRTTLVFIRFRGCFSCVIFLEVMSFQWRQ